MLAQSGKGLHSPGSVSRQADRIAAEGRMIKHDLRLVGEEDIPEQEDG